MSTYPARDLLLPWLAAAGLALAAGCTTTTTGATSAPGSRPSLSSADCFTTRDWRSWSSPNPSVIYIEARNQLYRVDLQGGGPPLDAPGRFLIFEGRGGSDRICGPIDLQLRLGDTLGFSTPLFPTGITKLTPEEVSALPREHRPSRRIEAAPTGSPPAPPAP